MILKEKVVKLVEKYDNLDHGHFMHDSHKCALIALDLEHEGIINVIVDLKGRGELSDKMYLKALDDINKEWQEVRNE